MDLHQKSDLYATIHDDSASRDVVIKSSTEIDLMREAGRINALALLAVKEIVHPGITTGELNDVAEGLIRQHGGLPAFLGYPGPYPYPSTLNVSINNELVHGLPGKRQLHEGDIVSIDCGTVFKGLIGDSAFTMGVGRISDDAQKLIDVTEKALNEGILKMRSGNRVGDVSYAIQRCVEGHGYYVPREYTGHGVGRRLHEGPSVPNYGKSGGGIMLYPGMTLALEPMVLIGSPHTRVLSDQWTVSSDNGKLTAHFEHTVLVTEDDPVILTII